MGIDNADAYALTVVYIFLAYCVGFVLWLVWEFLVCALKHCTHPHSEKYWGVYDDIH